MFDVTSKYLKGKAFKLDENFKMVELKDAIIKDFIIDNVDVSLKDGKISYIEIKYRNKGSINTVIGCYNDYLVILNDAIISMNKNEFEAIFKISGDKYGHKEKS